MYPDPIEAGLRPRLLRALSWGAFLWLASLLLPVRAEMAGAVWPTDLLGTPTGHIALGAAAFAGLCLGALALGRRTSPKSSRALIAMTACAVGLAGLLVDPDTSAELLPFLPAALSRGYVALVIAVAATAAGLGHDRPGASWILLALAAVSAGLLYLSPHAFGSLSEVLQQDLQAAIAGQTTIPKGALLTRIALGATPALMLGLALVLRARANLEDRKVVAAWYLAVFPAAVLALSFKGAAHFGADSYVLIGLRAASILLALTLPLTAALRAFSAHVPTPGTVRFRIVGHGATLGALLAVLLVHVDPAPTPSWRLGSAPDWAKQLYARDLPRLAIAAGEVELPGGQDALREATAEALAPLAGAPAMRAAVEDLGAFAENPGRHRRRLEAVGARINDAARRLDLPFYVDLEVVGFGGGVDGVRWMLLVKTYRIEQAHRFRIGRQTRTSLWLTRLDETNLRDARLGWTRHGAAEGMVVLGVVEDHWRQDLAPALSGAEGRSRRARAYARYARSIAEDLTRALPAPLGAKDLAALLECTSPRPSKTPRCSAVRARVEPAVLRALAEKVELHELRHAADGTRLSPPPALLAAMRGYAEPGVGRATAELSAYLAEVAGSRLPRLALAHFLALGRAHPKSPEGFAARLAVQTLETTSGRSVRSLMRAPASEVAAAAIEAHRQLFGPRDLLPDRLDGPDPAPLEDGPPAV